MIVLFTKGIYPDKKQSALWTRWVKGKRKTQQQKNHIYKFKYTVASSVAGDDKSKLR